MNTSSFRLLGAAAVGLALLHLGLLLLWGRGQILLILPWYAVVMDSVPILAALAVAVIAFGRYEVLREPTPFWIGVAFTAFALFALFDSLTAPSILPGGSGILGHLVSTSSWFWHLMLTMLGVFMILSILLRWPTAGARGAQWWLPFVIGGVIIGAALSWLLIDLEQFLPLLVQSGAWTPLNTVWDEAILILFAIGTLLSARSYRRTGNVTCAYLALSQLILTFAMVTDLIGMRIYDVWWYWRRILLVGAFSVMLVGFLTEYARLFRRERDRAHQLEAIGHLTTVLVSEVEVPRLCRAIIEESLRALHVDAAGIWLADPERHELRLADSHGLSSSSVEASRILSYQSPSTVALAARTETMQDIDDVQATTLTAHDREMCVREGLRSFLAVPLCARGHLVGVVGFANRTPWHISVEDRAIVTSAAGLFAVTIENSRLYDEVRTALRLREEFMAAAAHELRSPLTVIIGRAERTLKTDAHEEQTRLALDRILRASERINHLIEDLLAVLRIRPDFTTLQCERFDLTLVVTTRIEHTARTTEDYDFQVTSPDPLIVDADRKLISELIDRLVENAIRYSPDGGLIQVAARSQNGEAIVTVADHGIGIPSERQPFVFEPFYELNPGGSPGYAGLVSLGLFLSKKIVEAHGGRIWFGNTSPSGSSFSFSLPLVSVRSS